MYTISFITLGCKVNTYESNALEGLFKKEGFQINDPNEVSDVYVINTCTVTNSADSKSRKMIRHASKLNPSAVVCVLGCYSQMRTDTKDIPGVDIILGNNNKLDAVKLVKEFLGDKNHKQMVSINDVRHEKNYENLSAKTFEHTRAFLKIEEGCDNFCSYCIIPYARGTVRSYDSDLVISDLLEITSRGYKEVVLTGIHTGKYASNGLKLSDLVELILEKVPGLECLRLSSIEIIEIDDKLIRLMKENKVLANHMHLPLQSGSDKILKLMNRNYDTAEFTSIVEKIRAVRPNISITTDVIVGFPYETEEDFLDTYNYIKSLPFSELHVFPFSPREGTVAAKYPDMNGTIKKDRVKRLIDLSKELQENYEKQFVGQVVRGIVEHSEDDTYMISTTTNYMKVNLPIDKTRVGDYVDILIKKYENNTTYGEIID